jgi:hypothetical protein
MITAKVFASAEQYTRLENLIKARKCVYSRAVLTDEAG